jgi:hypothetical protein
MATKVPASSPTLVMKNSGSASWAWASRVSTESKPASRCSVIHVGGASSISPASRLAMASAAAIHAEARISPSSITTSPGGIGAAKK